MQSEEVVNDDESALNPLTFWVQLLNGSDTLCNITTATTSVIALYPLRVILFKPAPHEVLPCYSFMLK